MIGDWSPFEELMMHRNTLKKMDSTLNSQQTEISQINNYINNVNYKIVEQRFIIDSLHGIILKLNENIEILQKQVYRMTDDGK